MATISRTPTLGSRNPFALIIVCLALATVAAPRAAMGQQAPPAAPAGNSSPDSYPAEAADPLSHVPRAEQELSTLTQLLNLTADQQTGVKSLLFQQSAQIRALRHEPVSEAAGSEASETHEALAGKLQQIREETNLKINALLSEDQKKLFGEWVDRGNKRREQTGEGGGNAVPQSDEETSASTED